MTESKAPDQPQGRLCPSCSYEIEIGSNLCKACGAYEQDELTIYGNAFNGILGLPFVVFVIWLFIALFDGFWRDNGWIPLIGTIVIIYLWWLKPGKTGRRGWYQKK